MEGEKQKHRYEIDDSGKFPSMETALDEIRRQYDIEKDRKSNIEIRIGAIVGIDALLISVVATFSQLHIVTTIAVLIPALVAAGFGLQAFNSREYKRPGPNVDDIFAYARKEHDNALKDFIQNYRKAVKHNTQMNNNRMDILDRCFLLTAISFVLVLVSPLLDELVALIITHLV